jgi:hypothetical protein
VQIPLLHFKLIFKRGLRLLSEPKCAVAILRRRSFFASTHWQDTSRVLKLLYIGGGTSWNDFQDKVAKASCCHAKLVTSGAPRPKTTGAPNKRDSLSGIQHLPCAFVFVCRRRVCEHARPHHFTTRQTEETAPSKAALPMPNWQVSACRCSLFVAFLSSVCATSSAGSAAPSAPPSANRFSASCAACKLTLTFRASSASG